MTNAARRRANGCGADGTSLRPFRDRLEATYSASTNRVELPLADHEVPWEWK
jgi:hypothetical protein